jgi:photosynthetic reaction center cytochrome c subunit
MRPLIAKVAAGLLCLAALAGCERPPIDTVQRGYRGTAMAELYNPRILATQAGINQAPESSPPIPAPPGGPTAGQAYQNVKVLGDVDVANFARLMVAITGWVAPKEGCTYCHAAENFASDDKYTKVVARRMLEMTRHINSDFKSHVAATGVTCYTCHRGQPVPAQVWFAPEEQKQASRMLGNRAGQNAPAASIKLASLPNDPFTPYLLQDHGIRVVGPTALQTGNRQTIKQTEFTYGLMTHMSDALGVNCTYCHNSRSFTSWDQSTPQRVTAWHGIRMARELNNDYLLPLTDNFPAQRKGPTGDVAKINCATCHQGAFKPLYGAPMLADHPELASAKPAP